jgi:hypothetical protein
MSLCEGEAKGSLAGGEMRREIDHFPANIILRGPMLSGLPKPEYFIRKD